jgi:exonuclease III
MPFERRGYGAVWRGQKTWNGVAILARGKDPVLTRTELPGDRSDQQSRYIEAAVQGILIGCVYLPNGNPQPGPKYDYKMARFERLIAHAAYLRGQANPIVLAGDYNVVPSDNDIDPNLAPGMRSSSPHQERRSNVWSRRDGPTLSEPFIPRTGSTHSGTTSGTAGPVTRVSELTTSC